MRRHLALTTVTLLGLVGCGSGSSGAGGASPASGSGSRPTNALSGSITVLAAASLTGSFTRLGRDFEAAHPGTRVTFGFGPSSGLARSITAGAPADVFASASQKYMDAVTGAGLASGATAFAENVMEVAVPPANPAGITALADLARPGTTVALCQAQVPCGSVAAEVLARAGLTVTPVSQEVDVKAVLTKVQLGEVDAGVVYVTDVIAAGDKVRGVRIPADLNASTTYPIAALTKAPNPSLAKAFVDHVLSAEGQRVLAEAGFVSP
jgi:molybdate transport system substrate-binding protein